MHPPSKHACVTVIPVYKPKPNRTELLALLQLRFLGLKELTLVCPEGLDLSAYFDVLPELKVQRFSAEYFLSVQAYNDLVISLPFYQAFADQYEYLLIHQLDAFLLINQIEHFCSLGYDYFGAPWKDGFPQYRFLLNRWPIQINCKRFYVGNGGLSLRKIASTIKLLTRKEHHISKTWFMEDAFFGYWGSIDPFFRACSPEIAATFSLETEPANWVEKTGQLPMGFHGFTVWDPDFYRPLLEASYAKLLSAYPEKLAGLE